MTLYTRWFALAALVTGSLSASVPDQAGTGAADRNLMFSSLPPEPKCPEEPKCPPRRKCDGGAHRTNAEFSSPRERKEWRELSPTEIDKYACALKEMDQHTTKELRECYGETAWSFPDLVSLHACAAADPRGDQGHRTPGFMLFHKSYVLTFEEALLAVDPSIGATPWWNMALDSAPVLNLNGTVKVAAGELYCPTLSNPNMTYGSKNDDPKRANLDMGYPERHCDPEKYIWSCNYFGEMHGSGPNFEVTNGRWAYRKMPRWSDFDHEYWMKDPKYGVTNQCITDKYLNPRSANKQTALRKSPTFYGLGLDDDFNQETQNCERCCDAHRDGKNGTCTCEFGVDRAETYMRGPTLDTATCSPYVTRNPNGRGSGPLSTTNPGVQFPQTLDNWPANQNGRSQQDSLIRYTKDDFDACANSNNTRIWTEWQNCQEENLAGTLEGVYCPAGKETCKQSELEKVYALHSTGHDKTLGEIGDVTTSPSDPALFFSYHAYIDKNFMTWQQSMMDTKRMTDPGTKDLGAHDKSDPPDLTNKNYFGYPRQANLEEWMANVEAFEKVPFIEGLVNASNQRMQARGFINPVTFKHFDLQLWKDLLNTDGGKAWVPIFEPYSTVNNKLIPGFDTSTPADQEKLAQHWKDAATLNASDSIAIYEVHAGVDPNDVSVYNTKTRQDVYDGSVTDPNFLGPACSSATKVLSPDFSSTGISGHFFNPTFSKNCRAPTFPSPKPGSLTYNLTQGARTYSTSGPFTYMTQYSPPDFFDRGDQADPTLPWIPGTLLQDIANGGIPFRDIFPKHDGGTFGYSNKEIMEWGLPCFPGRSPDNETAPCTPYVYSDYNGEEE